MIEQGTEEWKAERCGKVTASRIADLMATTKSGTSASRARYMGELVAERLTGIPREGFTSAAMQWGTDTEPRAVASYTLATLTNVQPAPFVSHPEIGRAGASPDGFVGDAGLVEVKCPETHTHIETLRTRKVPDRYVKQIQWQLACTGRQWCDFVSYDPRMPDHMRLWKKRVMRDERAIAEITEAVREFLAELDATVAELREAFPDPADDPEVRVMMAGG